MGGGIAPFDWATRAMGKTQALVARTRVDHERLQGGPFAYVRNPIYVALFCFLLAIAIEHGDVTGVIFAIPVYAIGTGSASGTRRRCCARCSAPNRMLMPRGLSGFHRI